jgi:hypothetical protein
MQEFDILLTMAEVAIALAGFAGVVTAFQRQSTGHWPPGSRIRFFAMVENSLGAFAFSLIPLAFLVAEVPAGTTWTACSVLLALFIMTRWVLSVRRSGGPLGGGGNRYLAYFYYLGAAAAVIVLLLNAAGVGFTRSFTGYFLGLLWISFHAAMNFFRLTYVGLQAEEEPLD